MSEALSIATIKTENARCLALALRDITLADKLVDASALDNSRNTQEDILNLYEIARAHNATGGLFRILIDELLALSAALDELECAELERAGRRPAKKSAESNCDLSRAGKCVK